MHNARQTKYYKTTAYLSDKSFNIAKQRRAIY